MKVERIVLDVKETVRNILRALDHGLTPEDNMGATGAPAGHVLTSTDPLRKPSWQEPTGGTDGGGGGPASSVAWADITGKPNTLAGYGLDDDVAAELAALLAQIQLLLDAIEASIEALEEELLLVIASLELEDLISGDAGDMLRHNGTDWVATPVRWEPVTDGDTADPQLIFVDGDIIVVEVVG